MKGSNCKKMVARKGIFIKSSKNDKIYRNTI